MIRTLSIAFLLLATGFHSLRAQAPAASADTVAGRPHAVGQVEVSAVRLPRGVVVAKPLQQLDRAQIETLGLENLADAVKKFAGVNVRDYGGLGGMKTVSVRSLGAHHTAVSLDGVVLSNTQAGQIDLGRYDLDHVESITLGIGDMSQPLQTARHYASAAVLAIESGRPQWAAGRDWGLQARVQAGSWGYVRPSLRIDRRVGESGTLRLSGAFLHSDGDYPFTLTNVSSHERLTRSNGAMRAWRGDADWRQRLSRRDSLSVRLHWYWSRRGLPGSIVLYSDRADETLRDEDFFAQANYAARLNRRLRLAAHLKFTHSWNRYDDPRTEYNSEAQLDLNRQNEYYGSATLAWQATAGLTLAAAQDLSLHTLRTNIPLYNNPQLPNPRRLTSLTALSAQWVTERLRVEGNVVGTASRERVDYSDSPPRRQRLSPTVSLAWQPSQALPLRLRAMVKNTFRLPSFNDLYYRRSGNPKLRPEKAALYNLGITLGTPTRGPLRYIGLTLDGYYNHVHDKIVAYPSTYVWRMANFGKVRIWGAEATLTGELLLTRRIGLTLYATYTYQDARDRTSPASATYGELLPYSPRHSANASATLRTPWANLGYSLTRCGQRYSSAQNEPAYRLPPYTLHDLTLSRQWRLRACRLSLSASLTNLLDEQYDIVKYYPMPGRAFRLSAGVEL